VISLKNESSGKWFEIDESNANEDGASELDIEELEIGRRLQTKL